ncbi:MAG TPA: hypothetical protein VIP06_06050 [Nocardioides sp.]
MPIDQEAYSALLGFYLGDGYIAKAARYYFLRVTCDLAHPRIIDDVVDLLGRVRPGGKVFTVKKSGCVDIQSNWQPWPIPPRPVPFGRVSRVELGDPSRRGREEAL